MMTKEEAQAWAWDRCTNGTFPACNAYRRQGFPIGKIAEDLWHDTTFTYGIEYGLLIAVAKIYGDLEEEGVMSGVYKIVEHTGAESTHFAYAKDNAIQAHAIQAHLLHHGLLGLDEEPEVKREGNLMECDRSKICWDLNCVAMAWNK